MTYYYFLKGMYSNWHKSTFMVNRLGKNGMEIVEFNCMEQYMMWAKAMLFEDKETAAKILETTSPKAQQDLGRQVKNFNQEIWNENKYELIYFGLKQKFTQNQYLLKMILTEPVDMFVECNPVDLVWGVGLSEEDAKNTDPKDWPGENLLGKGLTQLKYYLLNETDFDLNLDSITIFKKL